MRPPSAARAVATAVARLAIAVLAVALLTGCIRTAPPRSVPAPVFPDRHELFIVSIAPWAQESQARTGVPASVTIGQAILESGWGDSALSMYAANYFGIKCSRTVTTVRTGCVAMSTTEYDTGGTGRTEVAEFRSYRRVVDSFVDHGLLLRGLKRYAKAFQHKDDPARFVAELQAGGYATDPNYARLVTGLIEQYDLGRYDGPTPVEPSTTPVEPSTTPVEPVETPRDESVAVRGWVPPDYRAEYARLGGPAGPLGHPVGGRRVIGDGSVDAVVFDGGLMINTPQGVVSLHGPVWQAYRAHQTDRTRLGWPTGPVETLDGVPSMRFDSGVILARSPNPIVVAGPIGARWIAEGADTGRLGLPTKPVTVKGKVETATFRGGTIARDTSTDAVEVTYS